MNRGVKVRANGIQIEVEDTGADGAGAGRPAVLLIMGMGMQLVAWPQAFVDALVGEGFRVVRFDNRDVGLSDHFHHLGVPNVWWETLKHHVGLPVRAPYTLGDMAADALGVLDALDIEAAHVVGVSLGGMIGQRIALAAPQRTLSLCSIMSSSGARYLPGPRPHVMRVLLGRPRSSDEQAIVDHYVKLFSIIGSPGFPIEQPVLRSHIRNATRRGFQPGGTLRQFTAMGADSRRADELPRIKAPTLVLHGRSDPLVPVACGEDTARRIPGARFVGIDGMGHDLAPGVVERLLDPLIPHLKQADR